MGAGADISPAGGGAVIALREKPIGVHAEAPRLFSRGLSWHEKNEADGPRPSVDGRLATRDRVACE